MVGTIKVVICNIETGDISDVSPLPKYAFMVLCSVRGSTGTTLPPREESHMVVLYQFTKLLSLLSNAVGIKCYDCE